jgi:hypothetical protein
MYVSFYPGEFSEKIWTFKLQSSVWEVEVKDIQKGENKQGKITQNSPESEKARLFERK